MGCLVAAWLAAMAYAFWWFLVRDLRPFYQQPQEQYALFESAEMASHLSSFLQQEGDLERSGGQVVVVHFWDPDCLCSRFNNSHVRSLIDDFGNRGVKFLIVLSSTSEQRERVWQKGRELFPSATLISSRTLALTTSIPASPSTAIIDSQGRLAYFGPYSLGGLCLSSDDGFVETILSTLLAGGQSELNTISGFGCFCAWREKA